MFDNIRADKERYIENGGWYRNLGFWFTLIYRYGYWTRITKLKVLKPLLRLVYFFLVLPIHVFYQVYIGSDVSIGPGFKMEHPFAIIISSGVVIGKNCSVFHDVTFGVGPKRGQPKLCDSVVIFPGAKVLGGISIGENAHIGANVVLTRSISPWVMVMPEKNRNLPMTMTKAFLKKKTSLE